MSKFGKKISTILLAAAIAVSSVIPAAAANSPTSGNALDPDTNITVSKKSTKITAIMTSDETVTVKKVKSDGKKATIPASVTYDGKTYSVDYIATGAITKKYNQVTLILTDHVKVGKKIAKNKGARNTQKIKIKSDNGKKLTASQFNKESFKGFYGKIIIKASSMTKKEFKKLVRKLRNGGFKGKIIRKK